MFLNHLFLVAATCLLTSSSTPILSLNDEIDPFEQGSPQEDTLDSLFSASFIPHPPIDPSTFWVKETELQDYWFVDGPYFQDKTFNQCFGCSKDATFEGKRQACLYWETHLNSTRIAKVEEVAMEWKTGVKWGERHCQNVDISCPKQEGKAFVCGRSTVPTQRVYGYVKQHVQVQQCIKTQGGNDQCFNGTVRESDRAWVDYVRPIPDQEIKIWCDSRDDAL